MTDFRRRPPVRWPHPADPAATVSVLVELVQVADRLNEWTVDRRDVPTGWAWQSDLPLAVMLNEPEFGFCASGIARPIAVAVSPAGPPGALFSYRFIDLEAPSA